MESYSVEATYAGENVDTLITGIFGRPDDLSLDHEKGVALTSSLNFFEKNKLGLSALRAENSIANRTLAGLRGIFGVSQRIFLMSEIDMQWRNAKGAANAESKGVVSYQRLGYEPAQGFQVYAVHQLSYTDFSSIGSRLDAFGPGIDFFPRPHFEIRAEYLKQRLVLAGSSNFDFAWLH